MISIAIADDHPIVLDGLEQLFRKRKGFKVVARCETAEEALDAVVQEEPDILVLDIRMPGKDGLWVLDQLGSRYATQVVMLTGVAEEREIAKALKLGARGVVLKDRAVEDLVECVRDVHAGKRCIDEEVLNRVVQLITHKPAAPKLTNREHEIVQLVARGLGNKKIAKELSISEETVKTHLGSIYQKLSVSGRVALSIWARENGLD